MTLRFAVVHEAEADFLTATELADRELTDAIDWLDEHLIGDQREWVGRSPAGDQLTWKQLKRLALEADVTPMGHFGGQPAFPDARAARRAIAYLVKELPGRCQYVPNSFVPVPSEQEGGYNSSKTDP
jgi:hypothetical protein